MDDSAHKKRILVVEDHPETLEAVERHLRQEAKMLVVAATNLQEALKALDTEHFNAIVVDLGLNPNDSSNQDGVKLLRYLKEHYPKESLIRIVLTSNRDFDLRNEIDEEFRVSHYIPKKLNYLDHLKESLESDFEDETFKINFNLDHNAYQREIVDTAKTLWKKDSILSKITNPKMESILYHEILDIFGGLFADAKNINVALMNPGMTASAVFKVKPLYDTPGTVCVVKIGRRQKIDEERNRYNRHVGKKLIHPVKLIGIVRKHYLGGLCYDLAISSEGEEIEEFDRLYLNPKAAVDDLVSSIKQLFDGKMRNWYTPPDSQQQRYNLLRLYEQTLNLSGTQSASELAMMENPLATSEIKRVSTEEDAWYQQPFEDHLARVYAAFRNELCMGQSLDADTVWLNFSNGEYCQVTNPLKWLKQRVRRLSMYVYTRITHGDLTGRNIMADNHIRYTRSNVSVPYRIEDDSEKPYYELHLIDFARTQPSHVMRDFVIFETDIKYRLYMRGHVPSLTDFETLENALLNRSAAARLSPDSQRVRDFIMQIRGLSVQWSDKNQWLSEYMIALVIATLNVTRFGNMHLDRRKQAILSAAMICDYLAANVKALDEPIDHEVASGITHGIALQTYDEQYIGEIAQALKRKEALLFIGYGVPETAEQERTPRQLAIKLAEQIHGYSYQSQHRFEYVFERYEEQYGRNSLFDQYSRYFKSDADASAYFALAARLPWPCVYTTNQHDFFERALDKLDTRYEVIFNHMWQETSTQAMRIYKLNSTLNAPNAHKPEVLPITATDYQLTAGALRLRRMRDDLYARLNKGGAILVMLHPTLQDLEDIAYHTQSDPTTASRVYIVDNVRQEIEKYQVAQQFNPLLGNPESILELLNKRLMG